MYRYIYVYCIRCWFPCVLILLLLLHKYDHKITYTNARSVWKHWTVCFLVDACMCSAFVDVTSMFFILYYNTLTKSQPRRTHIFYANISVARVLHTTLIYRTTMCMVNTRTPKPNGEWDMETETVRKKNTHTQTLCSLLVNKEFCAGANEILMVKQNYDNKKKLNQWRWKISCWKQVVNDWRSVHTTTSGIIQVIIRYHIDFVYVQCF